MLGVFVVLFVALVMMMLPILLGVYVYRDASRRQMNAVLWTVVTILVPGLIGFVVYLLVRGNYSDLKCPECSKPVKEWFAVCPSCGTKLRPSCPNCGTVVEPGWKVCPKCTQPLPEVQEDVRTPVRPKDHAFGKILAVILIVPLLLIGMLGLSFSAFNSSQGVCSMLELSREEYLRQQPSKETRLELRDWIDGLEEQGELGKAYALHYAMEVGTGNPKDIYVVYIPGAGNAEHSSLSQSSGLFGEALTLELESTGGSGSVYCLMNSASKQAKLKIKLDGKKIPCEVTEIDFDPVPMV